MIPRAQPRPRPTLSPVYAIADAGALLAGPPGQSELTLGQAVATMAAAGVRTIQLRAKGRSGAEQHRLLAECLTALAGLAGRTADLWMDDRADLAALHAVAGVHVGQRDLPPAAVRRVVGEERWIGLSTHDAAQVEAADADPDVDVVAIGPVFPTRSKERPDLVVGLAGVREARRRTSKPLVAIGGIGADNLAAVLDAGADSGVVLSAVCSSRDLGGIAAACRRLLAIPGVPGAPCASS